ncbi:hypothetical protein P7L78_09825 [Tistrella bauzanensis]|uniref:hypothetical protein n=1 Tax=Tistrella TaxID=171436 RepID=UPI0031F65DF2
MKIRITEETLRDPDLYVIFNVILLFVEERRHVIDPDYLGVILSSNWVKNLNNRVREFLTLSARSTSFSRTISSTTVIIDKNAAVGGVVDFSRRTTSIRPVEALIFLAQPFSVIVENEWFDGSFILWMAKVRNNQRFISAYRDRLFQFRHAGGKSELERSAKVLSTGVWPRSDNDYTHARRLWCGILLDSDSSYEGDDPNATIRLKCEPHTAWVRQLSARSIENFLPKVSMLNYYSDHVDKAKVHAYFNMSVSQMRHFNLKKGFALVSTANPSLEEFQKSPHVHKERKILYKNVSVQDWELLCKGFGSALSTIYTKLEHRPEPGKTILPLPGMNKEIDEILDDVMRSI